jgi:uncharacterized protein (DUF1330 family)
MPAYLIANYDITNPQGYSKYPAAVGPTVVAHGGELLVADFASEAREGAPGRVSIVVKFPSHEALQGWYESAEYQAIMRHRTDNTEGFVVFADGFAGAG